MMIVLHLLIKLQILIKILMGKYELNWKYSIKNLIKSLDILIKNLYYEYNSSRYLISAIIKM